MGGDGGDEIVPFGVTIELTKMTRLISARIKGSIAD